jgi:hypothetical protein
VNLQSGRVHALVYSAARGVTTSQLLKIANDLVAPRS